MQLVVELGCTAVVEDMVKRREVVGNLTEVLDWGRMMLEFATDQPLATHKVILAYLHDLWVYDV